MSAEFDDAGALAAAAGALKERDFGARIETYGPVPMRRVAESLGRPAGILPLLALGAALAGGLAFMGLCLYASGVDYVFDVGGRPRFSWPAFLVPSVSFGTLCGGLTALLALLVQNRLAESFANSTSSKNSSFRTRSASFWVALLRRLPL